jgi:hypothetical protein
VIFELVGSRDLADLGEGMIERVAAMVHDRGSDQSVNIHLELALAQSTATMPKCSGPTARTRGERMP